MPVVTSDLCRYGTNKRYLRPSLKLIGAKTKLRDLLYLHFKPHDVYVEPFLGTGGLLVGKERAKISMVGDLNEYLINYYKIIQTRPLEFFEAMRSTVDSLQAAGRECSESAREYFEMLKRLAVMDSTTELAKAVCFYVISKHAWNGLWRMNQQGEINSPWGDEVEGRGIFDSYWLLQVHKQIAGVEFNSCRYQYLLGQARHSVLKGCHSTFVFLDPPYHDCSTTYNGEAFNDQDFLEMASLLRDAPFEWLLTINDDAFTRDLFEGYSMIAHSVFYSCNVKGADRKKQPELLIANYELDPLPPVHQLSLFGG